MSGARRDASVVIATYSEDRWGHLVKSVRSLARQTLPPLEIVVVVDHNPRLLNRVRQALPGVLAVQNHHGRGLAGARNSGLAAARGEVVAFIDDDAHAARDWLERLRSGYSERWILGVGGSIEPEWQQGRPDWFPHELDWVVGCSYRGLPVTAAPVRNLIGCNMSFRREVVVEVGGFRSDLGRVGKLPLGCEETELCIRLRQKWPEHTLIYEPRASVRHHVPVDRQRLPYVMRRCYSEGFSKAQVARAVGRRDGLSSERNYALHILPKAVAGGLADSVLRARPTGFMRSGAIAGGLLAASLGYCHGWLDQRWRPPPDALVEPQEVDAAIPASGASPEGTPGKNRADGTPQSVADSVV